MASTLGDVMVMICASLMILWRSLPPVEMSRSHCRGRVDETEVCAPRVGFDPPVEFLEAVLACLTLDPFPCRYSGVGALYALVNERWLTSC